MRNRWLKKLRVALSLLFFLVMAGLYLDFTGAIYHASTLFLTQLQLVPSVILFISTGSALGLGFGFVILLTLLFGRIYCSLLCPMGTLQDIFIYLNRKLSPGKILYRYRESQNRLHFSILAGVALSLVTGSLLLVNLTDPYSMFGRIIHNLFLPQRIIFNNIAVKILTSLNLYFIYPVKWVPVNFPAILVTFSWFVLLLVMSAKAGRLYCNTVCPVGALLAILSRASLFRIRLDKSLCNSCGKCSAVCKAQCINPRNQDLDFRRCVGCMNCLSPCPEGGVKIVPFWKKEKSEMSGWNPARREFIGKAGILLSSVAFDTVLPGKDSVLPGNGGTIPATVPIFREHPVTPPGSFSRSRFNDLCTACHLCVSACPTQVLQPAWIHYGWKGFLQPRMDYITGFCNFECTLCGQVCPTGAILHLPAEEKKLVQIGKTKFIRENCIVYTHNTACGACSEHCPSKAVRMVPYKDKLTIPEVTDNICIGCGACEYACPTDPKSIYVNGNPLHLQAEKPKEEKLEKAVDYKEEFPF